MLQKCKLNLGSAEYERNIYSSLHKPSEKKDCVDSDEFWSTSIKDTIQWSSFLSIMEHTVHIMEKNNEVISSLLKEFAMFELRLNYKEGKLDVIYIRCINCKKETGLFFEKYNI